MRDLVLLLLFVILTVVVQTWFFPRVLSSPWQPDGFLVMTVYLAFFGRWLSGGLLVLGMGYVMDTFSGTTFGLYGLTLPLIFFGIHALIAYVNTETSFPFYYMVAFGTCAEIFLLAFFSFVLGDNASLWILATAELFPQAGLNLLLAVLLLNGLNWVRSRWEWAASLPGPVLEEEDLFWESHD